MDIKNLGKNIKIRKEALKLNEFNKRINISKGQINRILNGNKIPNISDLIKIARILKTLPSVLLGENVQELDKEKIELEIPKEIKNDFIEKYIRGLSDQELNFIIENLKSLVLSFGEFKGNRTYTETPEDIYYLGNNIKKYRELDGLNQSDISKMIQISPSHYNAYESGISSPKTETLIKISETLSVSPDILLGESFHYYEKLILSIFDYEYLKGLSEEEYKLIHNVIITLSDYTKFMRKRYIVENNIKLEHDKI